MSTKGYKHTKETKMKMSIAHTNPSEETRKKLSESAKRRIGEKNSFYGRKHTEISKRKMSKALKGRIFTKEHRRRLSEAERGRKNHRYGKTFSEETRSKMSEAQKGRKHPEEVKRRISLANLGRRFSKEHRRRISESIKGKNHPHWRGGISFEPYGPDFNEALKDQIRKRDNYRCQECFCHQSELRTKANKTYRLRIHHIDYDKTNNNPDNLISLCIPCHAQTNFKRTDWTTYYQAILKR